ncbi:hypothetical protein BN7_1533 [Wickerhamomyces ciferrii]|uniref:Uncharacterized protein n=1 Tax=Wickerhamomyces ciferrii (strain ATCC 14091 / BCRC 22168 / CBS 111 / JCM 3599 / NBRC 0793 / NRRL Y-1031 F-60-10) TaxID=1206466 RepID=K0KKK0_WICCF|nr:uncharacterized protein BN7_1533 [Wickerhamomyces ciferrii]CCH41994.1 hypothetical protein BN7_1533 [Wickerhamomyces ciferrii]
MFIKRLYTKNTNSFISRSLHNFNHPRISQAQLKQSIETTINNHQPSPKETWKSFKQITSIILFSTISTIGIYSSYQAVYKNEKTFVPLWINPIKRKPKSGEIDLEQIQSVAEDQILERLSLDHEIKTQFKLPIKQDTPISFDVWIEDKLTTLKGLQISPTSPTFSIVNKPIRIKKIVDGLLEPIGGILNGNSTDENFKIPVYNEHTIKEKDHDIVFLGEVPIQGQNGKVATVVFKGIFDFEHIKHAKIIKAHLITKDDEGNLHRKILWNR